MTLAERFCEWQDGDLGSGGRRTGELDEFVLRPTVTLKDSRSVCACGD
jgi:hypothetical protein